MKEKDVQSALGRYIKKNPFPFSCLMELKLCKTSTFSFSHIRDNQFDGLFNAKHKGIYHKMSDQSRGLKPADSFWLMGVPAYLIICFYVPRKKKKTVWIDIDVLLHEMRTCGRKSITEERAIEISSMVIDL